MNVDSADIARGRDQSGAVVNTVTNLGMELDEVSNCQCVIKRYCPCS